MDIKMINISDVIPYEKNAKKHPEEQVEHIANSIKRFGWKQPIVIDKENVVVVGHGRLLAAQKLGYEQVPVLYADDLTEDEIKAFRLADNKTNESEWDEELLDLELEELEPLEDIDMADFGFELSDRGGGNAEVSEDDYDAEPPKEPQSKVGDLYRLGNHKLICGDSTDVAVIERLMDGVKADMVFTDPPYGVAIGDKNAMLNSVQKAGRCTQNIENDTLSEEELYEMLKRAFVNVREHCEDDAVYFVTSPQGGSLGLMMMMMMKDAGLEVRHVLMWEKNSATFSLGRLDYDYQHEPIFYTWTKSHHNYRNGEYRTTIWKYDKPRKCDMHPTMKPIELVGNAVLDGTMEGMKVLDVFGGSGSTLIACEQLNRKCYMVELDPKYVDVIIDRWEKLTGNKAVKLN